MCRDCVELKKFNSSGRHDLLCPTKVVRIWLPIGGQDAGVAHPVERHLAKGEVASSSLVTRSNFNSRAIRLDNFIWCLGQVVRQESAKPFNTVL